MRGVIPGQASSSVLSKGPTALDPASIVERVARAIFSADFGQHDYMITGRKTWEENPRRQPAYLIIARAALGAALDEAANACEAQEAVFLSPEYATDQPLSSFGERFACRQCADAIRALLPADASNRNPEHGDLGSRNQSSGFGRNSSARKPDDANVPNQTPLNPQHSQGG